MPDSPIYTLPGRKPEFPLGISPDGGRYPLLKPVIRTITVVVVDDEIKIQYRGFDQPASFFEKVLEFDASIWESELSPPASMLDLPLDVPSNVVLMLDDNFKWSFHPTLPGISTGIQDTDQYVDLMHYDSSGNELPSDNHENCAFISFKVLYVRKKDELDDKKNRDPFSLYLRLKNSPEDGGEMLVTDVIIDPDIKNEGKT